MNAGVTAARGPFGFLLQTQSGQWLLLGLGAASLFPDKCNEIVRPLLRNILLGFPVSHDLALLSNGDRGSGSSNKSPSSSSGMTTPIVIQTSSNHSDKTEGEKILGQIVAYAVSAAGVWVTYTVIVNYLPEWIKEHLPVTRQVFDKAVQNLGRGIIEVSQQILNLKKKQDETHDELLEARSDILNIQNSVGRCEDALETAEGIQSKTQRGIKLLVRAVATMVPGNHNIADELNKYAREIDMDPEEAMEYRDRIDTTGGQNHHFLFGSPMAGQVVTSSYGDDSKFGKTIKAARTPMTRSLSDGGASDISEISVDGPKGTVQPQVMDGSVSYMSHVFPTPSKTATTPGHGMLKRRGSAMSLQNRIDSLLNHGRIY
eukprot:CAMPEP_0176495616 /NCGR_PEP_ID=MMETSP0200_2-20121128/10755_1 /TAXON_ID=947934 /ORGANISM="Chaetoceros sp., Strain GSL56" /LENGTH=372 /DNA_ID=CAMNT_0017893513 /DNA_START=118 /DNA_END=1236 /DNA_ORIENTATION=-